MDDARAALTELAANLRELFELLSEVRQNRVWLHHPHPVDQPKTRISRAPLGEHALALEHVRAHR